MVENCDVVMRLVTALEREKSGQVIVWMDRLGTPAIKVFRDYMGKALTRRAQARQM